MSQTIKKGVPSKLVIKNKTPGTISTGANTEIYLDGKRLNGVTFLKIEFKPAKLTKITMELYTEVEIETDVQFNKEISKEHGLKIGDKVYTLSQLQTVGVVEEP